MQEVCGLDSCFVGFSELVMWTDRQADLLRSMGLLKYSTLRMWMCVLCCLQLTPNRIRSSMRGYLCPHSSVCMILEWDNDSTHTACGRKRCAFKAIVLATLPWAEGNKEYMTCYFYLKRGWFVKVSVSRSLIWSVTKRSSTLIFMHTGSMSGIGQVM